MQYVDLGSRVEAIDVEDDLLKVTLRKVPDAVKVGHPLVFRGEPSGTFLVERAKGNVIWLSAHNIAQR